MGDGLRLHGEVRGKPIRLDVPVEGGSLGSGPECELVVPDPTVSRRHARLRPVAEGLRVEDLGSTNGTWIDGRRVDRVTLSPGASILFGRVTLVLEGVAAADRVVALSLPEETAVPAADDPPMVATVVRPAGEAAPAVGMETTLGLGPLDAVATGLVPRLLERLWEGGDAVEVASWAGSALLQILPLVELTVAEERGGILFQARGRGASEEPEVVERQRGHVEVRAAFAHTSRARSLAPLIDILALAVAIASDRERPLPRPGERPAAPPLPGGGSVDARILSIYEQAEKVAPGDVGVLVLGESGTGKEVLARWLHEASGREGWVALNCAALPRDLLEAELFGVEKGTATGVEPRPGKLELAHEGTLFLDEIGDMSLDTQAKILRVLQEGEVFRLGGSKPRPARARVVAATNKPVARLVEEGSFRLDLYHRIAGWVVELPPLRDRLGDIPNLAVRFLAEEGRKLGRRFRGISQGAVDALVSCPWPGNVRQLRQEIARCALFLDDRGVLEAVHLSPEVRVAVEPAAADAPGGSLAAALERCERLAIERALAACGGQVAEAAERLGVHRATLYRRMKALGLASADA